jgi:hypothetical protein
VRRELLEARAQAGEGHDGGCHLVIVIGGLVWEWVGEIVFFLCLYEHT